MKKNMGTTDRVIRIMLAVAIAILYISGFISGMMASILLILAGISSLPVLFLFAPCTFLSEFLPARQKNL